MVQSIKVNKIRSLNRDFLITGKGLFDITENNKSKRINVSNKLIGSDKCNQTWSLDSCVQNVKVVYFY